MPLRFAAHELEQVATLDGNQSTDFRRQRFHPLETIGENRRPISGVIWMLFERKPMRQLRQQIRQGDAATLSPDAYREIQQSLPKLARAFALGIVQSLLTNRNGMRDALRF